jgi:hypothetical protein
MSWRILLFFLFQSVAAGNWEDNFAAKASVFTSPVITTASKVIAPANNRRLGLILYNQSANSVYISFTAVGDSATTLCAIIPSFQSWTMQKPIYQGVISGIRNSGTGTVVVTELVSQ